MKLLLVLVATGCIAWLLKSLQTLQAPRLIEGYLVCLGLSYLMAYLVFPRIPQTERSYAVYFVVVTAPLAGLALMMAAWWMVDLAWERGIFGLIILSLTCMYFGWLFDSEIPKPKRLATEEMLAFGYCFCVAGLLALASAIPPCGALQFRLRIGFGIFWLLTGTSAFCDALGTFRARALWDSISSYATQVLCILCLGGLAWLLSNMQRELVRGPVAEFATEAVQP